MKNKFDTVNIYKALKAFDMPQNKLKNIIHVSGTNGKWSTIQFIQSILIHQGYTVNAFISPHLIKYNERFNLNGHDVDDKKLNIIKEYVKKQSQLSDYKMELLNELTEFEMSVLYCFLLFNKYTADFNIIEVGLGGIYDATNIIESPAISIITSISIDHTEYLGFTIREIAKSKAGIIKSNRPVIIDGNNHKHAIDIIKKYASGLSSEVILSKNHISKNPIFKNMHLGLEGEHQIQNANLAIETCIFINKHISKVQNKYIIKGLINTKSFCRLEKINLNLKNITFIIDGAHNIGGAQAIIKYIKANKFDYNICIFACLSKKKASLFINTFELFDEILIPDMSIYRVEGIQTNEYKHANEIYEELKSLNIENVKIINLNDINEYIKLISNKNTNMNNRIISFGSLYFCGAIRNMILK